MITSHDSDCVTGEPLRLRQYIKDVEVNLMRNRYCDLRRRVDVRGIL